MSIRRFLHLGARDVLIWVGNVFKRIYAKVIDIEEIGDLMTSIAETVCLLEIWFFLRFFLFNAAFDGTPYLGVAFGRTCT